MLYDGGSGGKNANFAAMDDVADPILILICAELKDWLGGDYSKLYCMVKYGFCLKWNHGNLELRFKLGLYFISPQKRKKFFVLVTEKMFEIIPVL